MQYILDGKVPIPEYHFSEWVKWGVNNRDKEIVNHTVVKNDVIVFTVFLGISFEWPPLVFATMIIGGDYDNCMWTNSTWEQAETCHNRTVKLLLNGESLE